MNFKEWAAQTALLLPTRYSQETVENILYAAVKAAIEELMANPAEANLTLMGVGRFYCNRNYHRAYKPAEGAYATGKLKLNWMIRFKPSRKFKEFFNGLSDPDDYAICGRYFNLDKHIGENYGYGAFKKEIKSPEIMHNNQYWLERIRGLQAGRLKLEANGSFSKVERPKRYDVDKRGRPLKKKSPEHIRDELMIQLRRDLKRELRQLRRGEITEADLDLAKYGCKEEIQLIREMNAAKARGEPVNYYHRRRKKKLHIRRKKKSEQVREQTTGCTVGEECKSEETS